MYEPFSFATKTEADKLILFFKQGEVYNEKDITGIEVPEDPQQRFNFLYQILIQEGWVPDVRGELVTG